jgi:S-adenosylmethionine-diacylglycerol 3-amino-3-carboxypropyl transferase
MRLLRGAFPLAFTILSLMEAPNGCNLEEFTSMAFADWYSGKWFGLVHGNNLVYNTCWEDPRLDRKALELGPEDSVLVITSAGCNALDYVLCEPRAVHAVDMNHRQNALLELKLSGIRNLDFETFFAIFGRGRLPEFGEAYQDALRQDLSPAAQAYWDRHQIFFTPESPRGSFYFHGTCGWFAYLMKNYLDRRPRLRRGVDALLNAESVEEQQEVYFGEFQRLFWNGLLKWTIGRDVALSLLGVPKAQREQVERHYAGGIAQFVEECLETVFAHLPLGDNYFWRVYLTGQYTRECCPEYLRPENFARLKEGLLDRVHVHTDTIEGFLNNTDERVSRFVLLDHMDWLSMHQQEALRREWQAIMDRAAPEARVLWRSGGIEVDFVDPLVVSLKGERRRVGELLTYHREMAEGLHKHDRVHTYGSFYIADLATA